LATVAARLLEQEDVAEKFLKVGLAAALAGDFRFWSYLFDRIEGRIGPPGEPETDLSAIFREAKARVEARKQGNGRPET